MKKKIAIALDVPGGIFGKKSKKILSNIKRLKEGNVLEEL